MELLERFLKYVSFDTQSDESSTTFPSTEKQKVLLNYLADEMRGLGLTEVEMDSYGYVMGTIPATPGCEDKPVIGFISHVDTSPDMSGKDIKPQIIEHYDGKDIRLNETVTMRVADFPELSFFKGHTLITTDGTTLLGADDKAGVAEIMTMAEYLLSHPEIKHGKIRIGFTPDEEVGRGVDYFDVARFGAQYAYTVDGGFEGELEYENFNAASAHFDVQGKNIHPGSAKDKMLNALRVVCEIDALLPEAQRPEHTEGYEGFYHLASISGSVEKAESYYIIRDHDRAKFEQKKDFARQVADFMNLKYGEGTVTLTLKDQYYNMREMVEPHPELIARAEEAMRKAGVVPAVKPIRGGTDGARLSYMGLPCPNLFTGGMNFHGKYEYASLDTMKRALQTLINLAELWAR
ncbi:MAG TPA: peptidase T [Candidatus Tidjanibacter faecipullorum]|uniref:Peptidase T n=1 Tax=Candidatus Tidjanibacter faecipullorum TaxID=2838766 RepID=A0A9D2DCD5_9BACT|nr:peptidase T [Candidatus Tidjanibacter faecipullorum]